MVDLAAFLELICLGPPTARLGGKDPPSDVLWRKHLGLLIYLALSPDRSRARDHLLGVFWPEKPEKDARHSLNEAVRRLRAGLGAGRLITHGELITLLGEGLSVDEVLGLALSAADEALAAGALRSGRRALAAAERVVHAGAADALAAARVAELRHRVEV